MDHRLARYLIACSATCCSCGMALAGNQPPVAGFTWSYIGGPTVHFVDTSTDGDGKIKARHWNFGDGTTSNQANPTHTFPSTSAAFVVTENVKDDAGARASVKQTVPLVAIDPIEQLQNSGFESTGSWVASAGVLCNTGCSGEFAHAGNGFAWLGGYGSTHVDTLSQKTVSTLLPPGATLSFQLHIDSAETTTTAYDKLVVAVYSPSGVLLRTLATFSNRDQAAGYHPHSYDMGAWIGQQITVKFTMTEDAGSQTSFVLDDVSLRN